MHLLICDDDARFAARVEQKVRDELAQRGIPAQITVCTRGEEALATPHLELYQVALLDVDLDTMNGISLGRQLRQSSPDIALIYISAYLEFAPEGYTVNAFRYILKRDMERMLPNCLEALFHEKTASGRKVLTIRQNRTEMELPYDSIYCLESDLRKVNVYGDVPHQPLCSYYGKLTDLPAELFENGFLRVGRCGEYALHPPDQRLQGNAAQRGGTERQPERLCGHPGDLSGMEGAVQRWILNRGF